MQALDELAKKSKKEEEEAEPGDDPFLDMNDDDYQEQLAELDRWEKEFRAEKARELRQEKMARLQEINERRFSGSSGGKAAGRDKLTGGSTSSGPLATNSKASARVPKAGSSRSSRCPKSPPKSAPKSPPKSAPAPAPTSAPSAAPKQWNGPGMGAASRRKFARLRQELLNRARALAGLPVSGAPLQQQLQWEHVLNYTQGLQTSVSSQVLTELTHSMNGGAPIHLAPGHKAGTLDRAKANLPPSHIVHSIHTAAAPAPAVAKPGGPSSPGPCISSHPMSMGPPPPRPKGPPGLFICRGVPNTPGAGVAPMAPGTKPSSIVAEPGKGKGKQIFTPIGLHQLDPRPPASTGEGHRSFRLTSLLTAKSI